MKKKCFLKRNIKCLALVLVFGGLTQKSFAPPGRLKSLGLKLDMTAPQVEKKITPEDEERYPNYARDFVSEAKEKVESEPESNRQLVKSLGKLEIIKNNTISKESVRQLIKKSISTHTKNAYSHGTGLPKFRMNIFIKGEGSQKTIVKLFSLGGGSQQKAKTMMLQAIQNEAFMTLLARRQALYCKAYVPGIISWGIFDDFSDDDRWNDFGFIEMTYLEPGNWQELSKIECPLEPEAVVNKIIDINSCLQRTVGLSHNDIYVRKETIEGAVEFINTGNVMLSEGFKRVALIDYGEATLGEKEEDEVEKTALENLPPCKFFKKPDAPRHSILSEPATSPRSYLISSSEQ